jgi:hypothetical protein
MEKCYPIFPDFGIINSWYAHVRIAGSEGRENEIMSCCERKNARTKIWFPPVNDCHTLAGDCITGSGLINPQCQEVESVSLVIHVLATRLINEKEQLQMKKFLLIIPLQYYRF